MNIETVESLLERSRPAPPPPDLRRRVLEAADRKTPPVPVSPRRPRFVEVMTMAASILMLLATVAWLLRATPPPPTTVSQDGQPFEERRLTPALPGDSVDEFVWSADGKHWGCITRTVKGDVKLIRVVVDGKPEQEYAEAWWLRFGADGHYAYIAAVGEGYFLVLDGVPQKDLTTYDLFAWSPDGKKLAYAGTKDNMSFVVEGGRRSGPYSGVGELLWSPDGSSLAYSARIDQDWFVVLNGKKGEPFDNVRSLAFTPDGKTLTYAAHEGEEMIVIGKVKGPEYQHVGVAIFSPDGTTVGYTTQEASDAYVVVGPMPGGKMTPSAVYEQVGRPAFSRDGKVCAYRAKPRDSTKERVVVNREQRQKLIRKTATGEEVLEVLGGRAEAGGTGYDSVSDPVLNADGSLVAYAAGKGSRKYLVVGNEKTVKFSLIDRISFGPDGATVAFRAGQYGKQLVVVGENRSDEFDEVVTGPVWSADGRKVAFTARRGSELWSRVLEIK